LPIGETRDTLAARVEIVNRLPYLRACLCGVEASVRVSVYHTLQPYETVHSSATIEKKYVN